MDILWQNVTLLDVATAVDMEAEHDKDLDLQTYFKIANISLIHMTHLTTFKKKEILREGTFEYWQVSQDT